MIFGEILRWWVVLFIIGVIFLPVTAGLFSTFFDKGYAFSKTIGLLCITFAMYSLGTLHILAFTFPSLLGITAVSVVITAITTRKTLLSLKNSWRIFLLEEVLFFLFLSFWAYIKSFQPDIHGLEKFMDFGFLNSLLRTTYFPAKDMWMTPLPINYYYFGHLVTAVLTKLSGLPSNITFNLMLSSLLAFTFLGSFSLGGNFVYTFLLGIKESNEKKISPFVVIVFGVLTATLLTFAGNLHTIYTFFTPYQNDNPVPPTQLTFSALTFPNQYWYPNATRFIYHTIHEFPIYSFVVSDLHGHVLDIPNVLLMIALLFALWMKSLQTKKELAFFAILLGTLSGLMYMTNE